MFNPTFLRLVGIAWMFLGIMLYIPILLAPDTGVIETPEKVNAFVHVMGGIIVGGIAEVLDKIKELKDN